MPGISVYFIVRPAALIAAVISRELQRPYFSFCPRRAGRARADTSSLCRSAAADKPGRGSVVPSASFHSRVIRPAPCAGCGGLRLCRADSGENERTTQQGDPQDKVAGEGVRVHVGVCVRGWESSLRNPPRPPREKSRGGRTALIVSCARSDSHRHPRLL